MSLDRHGYKLCDTTTRWFICLNNLSLKYWKMDFDKICSDAKFFTVRDVLQYHLKMTITTVYKHDIKAKKRQSC